MKKDPSTLPNSIICWNVNGVRALVKKGAFDWILEQDSDIFCLQETKAHPDQLDAGTRSPAGYQSFFDSSKVKKGYSGVAIYSKLTPNKVNDTIKVKYPGISSGIDQEGRFIEVQFDAFDLINCYFPNGGGEPARLEYKLAFYRGFIKYCKEKLATGREFIICGDFNIVHREIDAARFKENQGNVGFLPQERAMLDELNDLGLSDIFRVLYPDTVAYTWWDMKSFARERGIGWRIDTFFSTKGILSDIKDLEILKDITGSDHCPIRLSFKKPTKGQI